MKINSRSRAWYAIAIAALLMTAAPALLAQQYDQRYQISVVQQQVRTQMINDLLGTGHDFQFDNNASVRSSDVSRQNRITGTGRHRFNRSGWRTFSYEGEFSLRNGRVVSVDYQFTSDGNVDRPGFGNTDMTWSGSVDDVVRITVRGRNVISSGRTFPNPDPRAVSFNVINPLPRRAVTVMVRTIEGRGSVRVLEQPNSRNNYAVVIEIRDPRGGADRYNLELDWGGPGAGDPEMPRPEPGSGSMNWQGNVDDTVQIRIQRRQATESVISGRYPTSVVANFQRALPNRPVEVSLRIIEARGLVRILEQPNRNNGFSALIEIRDSRSGAGRYSFVLDWDRSGDDDSGGGGRAGMTWTGRVDGTARVTVQGRNATEREVQTGVRVDNVTFDFFEALPRRAVNVRLRVIDGRGTVRLISEPRPANGYSAVVEISDPQSGSDFYTFELTWDDNGSDDQSDREAQMNWRGSVDDVVQVRVSGRSATSRAVSGQQVSGVRFNFAEALPRRAVDVTVNKREGRGDVRVIQQPTRFNNFTAIIEIVDRSGGRDTYEFDLNW